MVLLLRGIIILFYNMKKKQPPEQYAAMPHPALVPTLRYLIINLADNPGLDNNIVYRQCSSITMAPG
jgi:hypothetical protein